MRSSMSPVLVVVQQPPRLVAQRGDERPVGQAAPGQRRGLADPHLRARLADPPAGTAPSTSLVLPMPAAPVISTTWERPAATSA